MSDNNIYNLEFEWKAKCPRCGIEVKSEETKCSNCYKGHYQLKETHDEGYVYTSGYVCDVCGHENLNVVCHGCGAEIRNQIEKVYGKLGLLSLIKVLIIAGLVIYAIYFIGWKVILGNW